MEQLSIRGASARQVTQQDVSASHATNNAQGVFVQLNEYMSSLNGELRFLHFEGADASQRRVSNLKLSNVVVDLQPTFPHPSEVRRISGSYC